MSSQAAVGRTGNVLCLADPDEVSETVAGNGREYPGKPGANL